MLAGLDIARNRLDEQLAQALDVTPRLHRIYYV